MLVRRDTAGGRPLEQALKATSAKTVVETYKRDDAVIGELSERADKLWEALDARKR